MMRNFLLLLFVCVSFGLNAQYNANLDFVNPEVIPGSPMKYRITLQIKNVGSAWSLGSTNLRFNYPSAVLSNPVVYSDNFTTTGFGTTTTSGSTTTVVSANTVLASGLPGVPIAPNATFDMVTMEFNVVDPNLLTNVAHSLVWRITGSQPRTALVTDNATGTQTPTPAPAIITPLQYLPLNPLPIELTSFTGKANGEVNTMRWEVAYQSNVSHFEVERSADGVNNFRAVTDNIAAAGTINLKMTYSADDKTPISMGYYRLVSVDKDGTKDYSKVITIDRRNRKFAVVEVAPNPTTDAIRVNFDVKTKGDVSVSLTDALGRVVMTQNQTAVAGNNNLSLDMSSLASGTYYLSLSDGVNSTVEKVVKQ